MTLLRSGCRVLVADDHSPLNEMISEALRGAGFAVDQAGDGRRALEMLRGGRYGVAVLDVRMPGMSGFELLARLRSEGIECATIMMSVVADPESRRQAAELGAIGFHQKPFTIDALTADVRDACPVVPALR